MGLFFDVLSAINDPNQSGSVEQLGTVMDSAKQLGAASGLEASTLQTVMSSLGGALFPALKQQSLAPGGNQVLSSIVNQVAGVGVSSGATAMPSFITPELQQQIVQAMAQKTGLNAGLLQSILPGLISTVLGFLGMGAPKPGVAGVNPILNAVLDGNHDGNTDLGEVFKFANRFLNVPS
ncbi:MAG: DUF937 domain-containing protein [Leptolyngbya sp. BL-A-14]